MNNNNGNNGNNNGTRNYYSGNFRYDEDGYLYYTGHNKEFNLEYQHRNDPPKYYVAYGSNLNVKQMKFRCPDAKIVGTAFMRGYELLFKGSKTGSYCTVEKCKGTSVPVAVWQTNWSDERSLDAYEGYPQFYYKKNVRLYVKKENGKREWLDAYVYIMLEEREYGMPSETYIETVSEGYEAFGFDKSYLGQAVDTSAMRVLAETLADIDEYKKSYEVMYDPARRARHNAKKYRPVKVTAVPTTTATTTPIVTASAITTPTLTNTAEPTSDLGDSPYDYDDNYLLDDYYLRDMPYCPRTVDEIRDYCSCFYDDPDGIDMLLSTAGVKDDDPVALDLCKIFMFQYYNEGCYWDIDTVAKVAEELTEKAKSNKELQEALEFVMADEVIRENKELSMSF